MSNSPQKLNSAALAVPSMIGAAALVAMTSIIGKSLGVGLDDGSGLHPLQISAGRFCFAALTLLAVLCVLPASRPTFSHTNWTLHLMRSVCGWSGVTAMFAAVAKMPVADATAISFLSPIVTMALAALMLNEHIGLRKVLASVFALAGAMLILRPGTDAFQAAGLFALLAAALMGLEAIFIKRLTGSEPAMRILVINNLIGTTIALTVAAFVWTTPTGAQWMLLISLGVVMVSGQALFIQSMKRGAASLVMPAFYFVLVFAALYDFALFGVIPSVTAIIGSATIVLSAVMLGRLSSEARI
ncbi:DMT family transporter [Roseobacter sp. A03A-229]